ncbi:MAG: 2-oxoacid:acceptor oxidoreductase family protein [candidate division WOR-3 bacterium]
MIEIKIIGKGGQGIVLVGEVLAHASVLEGSYASAIAGYGSQARGGEVSCDVIIAQREILAPFVMKPDYLLCLSFDTYQKNRSLITEKTKVFLNTENQEEEEGHFLIPASGIAQKVCQNPQVANMVMLGAFTALTKIVSLDSIMVALSERMKGKILEGNIRALKEGYQRMARDGCPEARRKI